MLENHACVEPFGKCSLGCTDLTFSTPILKAMSGVLV